MARRHWLSPRTTSLPPRSAARGRTATTSPPSPAPPFLSRGCTASLTGGRRRTAIRDAKSWFSPQRYRMSRRKRFCFPDFGKGFLFFAACFVDDKKGGVIRNEGVATETRGGRRSGCYECNQTQAKTNLLLQGPGGRSGATRGRFHPLAATSHPVAQARRYLVRHRIADARRVSVPIRGRW